MLIRKANRLRAGATAVCGLFIIATLLSCVPVRSARADSLPNTGAPPGFAFTSVAEGFELPTAARFAPDGRIFVAQKNGVVRIVKDGQPLAEPFYQVPDINDYVDRGLLGLALDPNFAINQYVYLLYTYETNPAQVSGPKTGRLLRVTADGDTALAGSEQVILGSVVGTPAQPSCQNFAVTADCVPADGLSHAPASLGFAPDGTLFVSLGDASGFDDRDPAALRAQNLDSLAGKVLRINPDGTAPANNPFYNGNPNANRSKVYASGLRNPFRITHRPSDGVLVLGDVGWGTWEEVNTVPAGANLGWPCFEGNEQQNGSGPGSNTGKYKDLAECQQLYANPPSGLRAPIHVYPHPPSSATVGGLFYTGTNYPAEYQNSYFYGDYAKNQIYTMSINAAGQMVPGSNQTFASNAGGPVNFFSGPEGDVYFVGIMTGAVYHITYSADNQAPIAVAAADKTSGPVPLTVNFTSGGSMDPDGDALAYTWNFGDGSSPVHTPDAAHTYVQQGTYTATLTVTDEFSHSSLKSLTIHAGQTAPIVTIASPSQTSVSAPGQTIAFSGSATDAQDGTIPSGNIVWRVVIQHCPLDSCHAHTLHTTTGSGGSFPFPAHDGPYYIQISATATDSTGLSSTQTVSVYPEGQAITHGLQFDGLNDYAVADNPADFMSQQFTVEAMVKTLSTDVHGSEIASMGNNWVLRTQPDGSLLFSYASGGGNWQNVTANVNIADGVWHHVAATRTTNAIKLYVDGTLRAQLDTTALIQYAYGGDMIFGRHGTDNTYKLNGTLDEVRFWTTPRSDADINTFHTTTLPSWSRNGLAAYYRINEGTGATVADEGPTGTHPLRLMNGPVWTAGAPLGEPSLPPVNTLADTFNAAAVDTNKWEFIGASARSVQQNGQLTVSPLANANAHFGLKSKQAYNLTGSSAFVEVPQVTNPVTTAETQFIVEQDWQNQLIIMRSGTQLYLRHRIAGNTTNITVPYDPASMRWWRLSESGGTVYFETSPNGLTWTVRRTVVPNFDIKNTRLLLVAGTYLPTANPGSAKFDNLSIPPPVNNALGFNGSTGKATAETAGLYNTQTFTAELWAKVQATGTYGSELLSYGNNYGLRVETDGKLAFFFHSGGGNFSSYRVTNVNLKDNAWHHIAVVKDAASVKLYIDTVLRGQFATSSTVSYTQGTTLSLGQHPSNTSFNLTGTLDEVRIWDTARTRAQLQTDWKRELSAQAGLRAYWLMNEPSGTVVTDTSGNSRTLTLTPSVTRGAGFPKQ